MKLFLLSMRPSLLERKRDIVKYLFDTDTVTRLLKPKPPTSLIERMKRVEVHAQFISTITILEISYGAYKSSNPRKYLDFLETEVLPRVRVLSFDDNAAYMAWERSFQVSNSLCPRPSGRIAELIR